MRILGNLCLQDYTADAVVGFLANLRIYTLGLGLETEVQNLVEQMFQMLPEQGWSSLEIQEAADFFRMGVQGSESEP